MYRLGVCMCNPESGSLIVTSLKLIEVVQVFEAINGFSAQDI